MLALADPSAPPTAHQTVPDSSDGPFRRPDAEGFGGPYDYLPALPDSEKPSATIPQGRPPRKAVRQGEAFRSPSSPDEDPLKMSSAEKGGDPNYKVNTSVILRSKNRDVPY